MTVKELRRLYNIYKWTKNLCFLKFSLINYINTPFNPKSY